VFRTLPAVFEFDPACLALTAYGRMNAGTARGALTLVRRFLDGFFRICGDDRGKGHRT
jgi:hypothetical protein